MTTTEGRTRRAERLLREALAGGPIPARTVERLAEQAGVSRGTLVRARYRVGVVASKRRTERGAWVWSLAEEFDRGLVEGAAGKAFS